MTSSDLAALEPETKELRRFFDLSQDLLCIRGADGYVKKVNPAFSEALGYTEAHLLGHPIVSFLHPEDVETTDRLLAGATAAGRIVTFEERWRCHDGSYRCFAWRAASYPDEGVVYTAARDVTEERERERSLREATTIAEEANRAKSEFLANMSHEIRTPMNGVIGMTELALETNLSDQQREYLQMVQNSAEALLETINSILDFSKMEAGKMELEAIDFTLWETVTAALKPLALTARNKRVELLYDEAADVPERLRGDPGRLRQALINLVGNAVKFTHAGAVRLTVSLVGREPEGVRLRFEVADTGIGIAADKLEHIVRPFNQADGSMSRRFGGTGLGLAITKGLVDMMRGRLSIESREGEGSTFSFTALFAEAQEGSRPLPPGATLEGLRVLCVDDHEANRLILGEFSRRMGMDALTASSAVEALEALDEAHRGGAPVDLALLDCQMPDMGGFELAERIRADGRYGDLVLVAFTAAGRPGDGARCEELGIASYLLKPLAPAELRDALLLTLARDPARGRKRELVTRHSLREARSRLRVLLAEDNLVNQQLATHLLQRFGHRARLAVNGREAVEAWEVEPFDVVLMDVQMPGMDGVEATQRIRAREAERADGRRTPIIAMTAHAMVGDRERFIEAGMDDYISKPMSKERLREVLRAIERPRRPEERDLGGERHEPVAASAAATPSFDRRVLLERTESDVELIRALVTVFLSDNPSLLGKIERALSAGDAAELERAAHTIKGALGVFGAEPARARAERMERMGRDGAVRDAAPELDELSSEVQALERDLRALLSELEEEA